MALLLPMLVGAQNLQNYVLSIENSTWQSIASTGTRLNNVYYNYTETIQLPFDLEFGEHTFYQGQNVRVTGRGSLVFGNGGAYSYAYTHWNSPSNEYVIIPFFMGQAECPNRNTSQVYWLTRPDDRGGQEMVVEWTNIKRASHNGESVAYQVHVHSNGDIGVMYGPITLSSDPDTLFTFAMVAGSANDRVLITGDWNTSSSITKVNPSTNISHWPLTPLMGGTPAQGLYITYLRPLPPCPHPTHLTMGDVQQQTATVSWTGNGVAGAQYAVQYDTVDFTPGTPMQGTLTVNDTFINLTGLAPAHHYYVYVRAVCGGDISNWEGIDFWTPCEEMTHAELPYTQMFESTASAECWRKFGTVYWSTQSGSGANVVRYCNIFGESYAIMQPMDWVNDLQVSFDVKGGPVMVGVMDGPYDTSTFVPLHECWANNAEWYPYTVRLSGYSGNGKYIVFKAWPNQYGVAGCNIDNVVLDTIQGCIAPEHIVVERYNAVSADIRWTDYDSVGSYRVVYQGAGFTPDTLYVSTTGCTLTGLTPSLGYTVAVSILCDSTTVGPADTVTFTTLPTCMTPVAVNIDNVTGRSATVHWTEMNTVGTYLVVLKETFGDTISIDTVVADTTITYNNLQTNRQYRVDVRQLCSGVWTAERWDTFRTTFSCSGPQGVNADSVTTSTAVITSSDSLGSGPYRVIIYGGGHTDTIVLTSSTSLLTGLAAATSYNVVVSTVCIDSSFSDAVSVRFATPCNIITHADIPYVETFDNCFNGDAGSLSPCWTIRSYAPSNYVGMFKPLASVYHGTSGLSLYAIARMATEPVFIALPEVDSLNDLVLNFWVYCTMTGDAKVDIGVMTDPTDSTTFTSLQSYFPDVRNQWLEVEVPLSSYTGTGRYAALRAGTVNATVGDALYFDDIRLQFNLSCERPDSLIVDNLTDTSAMLTIVPSADADSDAAAYHVVVSSHYGNDTMILTSSSTLLTNLLPATDYEVEVRSECPEGGLTTATFAQFTTPCGAYRLPYFEDFENQDEYQLARCWELMDSGSVSPQVRSTWVTPYSGRRAMVVNVYDSAYSSFATPWIRPYNGPVMFSFMAKAYNYRYMVDTMPVALEVALQNADTMVTIFSNKVLYADWTQLDFTAATGLLATGGRFVITIVQEADSNGHIGILHIDDVSVVEACLPVTGLEVVTTDSIPVGLIARWIPMGIETRWEVSARNYMFRHDTVVNSPMMVLTGLLPDSTDYWLGVRPICGEGDTGAWSDIVAFRTPDPYNPQGINSALNIQHSTLAVYPNPTSGKVTVEWPEHQGTAIVEMLDVSGRQCGRWTMKDRMLTINVGRMPVGAYFLRVTHQKGTEVRRLTVR